MPFVCNRAKLDPIKLWHKRLDHINYRDLVHLVYTKKFRGIIRLSGEPKPICGECIKDKQTKSSLKNVKGIRTTRLLNLLHMDLMSSMQLESRGGKRHVLVVVGDFSRYFFVSFLKEKSKAIENLKSLFNRIQVEIGHPIVKIRSDNEIEFDNMDVNLFSKSKEIKHEFSTSKTPQHNEVVERNNIMLQEMARGNDSYA